MRVRPLLDHDRKQEVCVSASGGENGEEHEATYTKTEICATTSCISMEKAVSFPPREYAFFCPTFALASDERHWDELYNS